LSLVHKHLIGWLVEQGLTSHSTQFRSFRRRCFYIWHWKYHQNFPDILHTDRPAEPAR